MDFSSPSAPAPGNTITPGSSFPSLIDDNPSLHSSEAENLDVDPLVENSENIELSSVQHPLGGPPCLEENPDVGGPPCLEENSDSTPVAIVSPQPTVSASVHSVPVIPNSPQLSRYLIPPLVRRNRN